MTCQLCILFKTLRYAGIFCLAASTQKTIDGQANGSFTPGSMAGFLPPESHPGYISPCRYEDNQRCLK